MAYNKKYLFLILIGLLLAQTACTITISKRNSSSRARDIVQVAEPSPTMPPITSTLTTDDLAVDVSPTIDSTLIASVVPTPTMTGTAVTSTPIFFPTSTPLLSATETPILPALYIVQPGDTISKIALKMGIPDWQLIAALNNLADPNLIEIGQLLKLPSGAFPISPMPELTTSPTAGSVIVLVPTSTSLPMTVASATPTATPTPTASLTASPITALATSTPQQTSTPTPTKTPTARSNAGTVYPTYTPYPTSTPYPLPTYTPNPTYTPAPLPTWISTSTPVPDLTSTSTLTPTPSPTSDTTATVTPTPLK
jgi:LysM repeat protein